MPTRCSLGSCRCSQEGPLSLFSISLGKRLKRGVTLQVWVTLDVSLGQAGCSFPLPCPDWLEEPHGSQTQGGEVEPWQFVMRSIQQPGGIRCWEEPPWFNQDVTSAVPCLPLKTPAEFVLSNYMVMVLILFMSPVGAAEAPQLEPHLLSTMGWCC